MKSYPHMCRDGHLEIGHADSENELCPLCAVIDQRDTLAASLDASRIETAHHSRVSAGLQMRAELAESRIAAIEAALREIGTAKVNSSIRPGEYRDGVIFGLDHCATVARNALRSTVETFVERCYADADAMGAKMKEAPQETPAKLCPHGYRIEDLWTGASICEPCAETKVNHGPGCICCGCVQDRAS